MLAGGEDRITPARVVRKVARRYGPQTDYKEFPDHAHWLMAEPGWEQVANHVADWLGRLRATESEAIAASKPRAPG